MMIEKILIELAATVIITVSIDKIPVDLFLKLVISCEPLPSKTMMIRNLQTRSWSHMEISCKMFGAN